MWGKMNVYSLLIGTKIGTNVKEINMEVSQNIKNRTIILLKLLGTCPENSISYYRDTY